MATGGQSNGLYIGAPGTIGAAIARDDRLRQEEQAQRQAQAGNIALRSLIGGMQAPGTPATKSYEVNGRTIGQNREAVSGAPAQATQLGLLSKFAPGVVQSALAQQAMQRLGMGAPKAPIVAKPGEVVLDPNNNYSQIASVPLTPETPDLSKQFKQQFGTDVPTGYAPVFVDGKMTGDVRPLRGMKEPTKETKDTFGDEARLRGEFDTKTNQFGVIRDAYSAISEFANNPSAAGDVSLVYQFMKMQDPNSTVREGEYATAENAGGVPERLRNMFNKLKDGQFLTPQQRADFVKQSGRLYDSRLRSYKQEETRYQSLAKQYGFDPNKITYDRSGGLTKTDIAPPMAGDVQEGWRFKGGDPADPQSWEKVG